MVVVLPSTTSSTTWLLVTASSSVLVPFLVTGWQLRQLTLSAARSFSLSASSCLPFCSSSGVSPTITSAAMLCWPSTYSSSSSSTGAPTPPPSSSLARSSQRGTVQPLTVSPLDQARSVPLLPRVPFPLCAPVVLLRRTPTPGSTMSCRSSLLLCLLVSLLLYLSLRPRGRL